MDVNAIATLWVGVKPDNLRKLQLPAINDQCTGTVTAGGETLEFFLAPEEKMGLGLELWEVGSGEFGDMPVSAYASLTANGKARMIRALRDLHATEPETVVEIFFITQILD